LSGAYVDGRKRVPELVRVVAAVFLVAAAKDAVRSQPRQEVPLALKDAHNATNKRLGQGGGYRYSHDYPEGISGQDYLARPLSLSHPGEAGAELAIAERLARWRELKAALKKRESGP
jgi:putative ATPase